MEPSLVTIAEKYGLVDESLIPKRVEFLETKEVNQLYDELQEALRKNQLASYDLPPSSFNYFVSSAMRGDRLCRHPLCRLKKLPLVERYAALYGDHLLLPTKMIENSAAERRLSTEALLLAISALRPLIDAGMVIPMTASLCVCKKCREKLVQEEEAVDSIGKKIAMQHFDRFSASCTVAPRGQSFRFTIRGPEEFVEGGGVLRIFPSAPSWLSKANRKRGGALTREELASSGFVADLFNTSAFDIVSQASVARKNGCSYLSDSEAEAAFFDDPALGSQRAFSQSQFAESLLHDVPMFSELPVGRIVDLRRENPESFSAYRSALIEATANQDDLATGGHVRARDFYRDVIEPKVEALRLLEATSQRSSIKAMGSSLVLPAVSLMFGLLENHIVPHGVADVAKVLGAAGIANAISEPLKERAKKNAEIVANPMFFLLKLDKAWKEQRRGCRS